MVSICWFSLSRFLPSVYRGNSRTSPDWEVIWLSGCLYETLGFVKLAWISMLLLSWFFIVDFFTLDFDLSGFSSDVFAGGLSDFTLNRVLKSSSSLSFGLGKQHD